MIESILNKLGYEKKKEKQVSPWVRFKEGQKHWLDKIEEYVISLDHPDYDSEEEYVMQFSTTGAKGIRFAEPDKDNAAPRYLLKREAIRMYGKGRSNPYNNYAKLIVRIHERLQEELLDENAKELGDTYSGRAVSNSDYNNFSGKKQFGELDHQGWMWSPTFRKYYPQEEFEVIGKIDRLYMEWGQSSYKRGIELKNKGLGDPGTIRKEWKESGYAEEMIKRYNLPVDKFMNKLTDGYSSRK